MIMLSLTNKSILSSTITFGIVFFWALLYKFVVIEYRFLYLWNITFYFFWGIDVVLALYWAVLGIIFSSKGNKIDGFKSFGALFITTFFCVFSFVIYNIVYGLNEEAIGRNY